MLESDRQVSAGLGENLGSWFGSLDGWAGRETGNATAIREGTDGPVCVCVWACELNGDGEVRCEVR